MTRFLFHCMTACLLVACAGGNAPGRVGAVFIDDVVIVAANPSGSSLCCDPAALPTVVGFIELAHSGTATEPYQFRIASDPRSGLLFEPSEGSVLPPAGPEVTDPVRIRVSVTHCNFTQARARLTTFFPGEIGVPLSSEVRVITITNACPPRDASPGDRLSELAGQITSGAATSIATALVPATTGLPQKHTSEDVPDKIPDEGGTDILVHASAKLPVAEEALTAAFGADAVLPLLEGDTSTFPPGQGPNGFTIAAEPSAPLLDEEHVFVGLETVGDIPLDSPDRHYQYGFVFDADNLPENNFLPQPPFTNDFFRDTDRWYELLYTPTDKWSLQVTNARGGVQQQVPSGARAIISGNAILLVVPLREFNAFFPQYRVSAFCHGGDFGLNPPHDWSGGPEPDVDQPLQDLGR